MSVYSRHAEFLRALGVMSMMPGENYNWPVPKQRNESLTKYNTNPSTTFVQTVFQV